MTWPALPRMPGLPHLTGRSFHRRDWRYVLLGILLLALLAGRMLFVAPEPRPPEVLPAGVVRVERVVDGDTLLLDDHTRVRLYGVDAPESVKPDHPVEPFGPEAAEFTRKFISRGEVRLTFDREREDQFGRKLAYVWVGDELLNEELLRAGLARARLQYHFSDAMKRRFRQAEQEAKRARRGIWSKAENGERRR